MRILKVCYWSFVVSGLCVHSISYAETTNAPSGSPGSFNSSAGVGTPRVICIEGVTTNPSIQSSREKVETPKDGSVANPTQDSGPEKRSVRPDETIKTEALKPEAGSSANEKTNGEADVPEVRDLGLGAGVDFGLLNSVNTELAHQMAQDFNRQTTNRFSFWRCWDPREPLPTRIPLVPAKRATGWGFFWGPPSGDR